MEMGGMYMKIEIDGFFDSFCQDCPMLDIEKSVLFEKKKPHYKCKNNSLCTHIFDRMRIKLEAENEN